MDRNDENLSNAMFEIFIQRSAVTVTPSGIGNSVAITECHSNSGTLVVLNESGIAKTVTVADCHSNRCPSNRRPLYLDYF